MKKKITTFFKNGVMRHITSKRDLALAKKDLIEEYQELYPDMIIQKINVIERTSLDLDNPGKEEIYYELALEADLRDGVDLIG